MNDIDIQNINQYCDSGHVLKGFSLFVQEGSFVTILGPSGAGKTVALRVIAGAECPQSGQIRIGDRRVFDGESGLCEVPAARGAQFMFGASTLIPHFSVLQNVLHTQSIRETPRYEQKQAARKALDRAGILALTERAVNGLTAEEQHLVALARALMSNPSILLVDELDRNMDARQRLHILTKLKRLQVKNNLTVFYATRDARDAFRVSDRIAVLLGGRLAQADTPSGLYRCPVSLGVADYIGNSQINLIPGKAQFFEGRLTVQSSLGIYQFAAAGDTSALEPGALFDCVIGVRPDQIVLWDKEVSNTFSAEVMEAEFNGQDTLVHACVGNVRILARRMGCQNYAKGERVFVAVDPESVNLYHQETGALLKRAQLAPPI